MIESNKRLDRLKSRDYFSGCVSEDSLVVEDRSLGFIGIAPYPRSVEDRSERSAPSNSTFYFH